MVGDRPVRGGGGRREPARQPGHVPGVAGAAQPRLHRAARRGGRRHGGAQRPTALTPVTAPGPATMGAVRRGLIRCGAAALLFGASTPVASQLAGGMGPFVLAGLLYLGGGLAAVPQALRTPPTLAACGAPEAQRRARPRGTAGRPGRRAPSRRRAGTPLVSRRRTAGPPPRT